MATARVSAAGGVGVPVLLAQYMLPLRELAGQHRYVKRTFERKQKEFTRGRKRDLAKYGRLAWDMHMRRRAVYALETAEESGEDVAAELAVAEAELKAAEGRYRIMSKALSLFLIMAKLHETAHLTVLRQKKEEFRLLLTGAIRLACVFGRDLHVDGKGRNVWDDLSAYKKVYANWEFGSMVARLNLFR